MSVSCLACKTFDVELCCDVRSSTRSRPSTEARNMSDSSGRMVALFSVSLRVLMYYEYDEYCAMVVHAQTASTESFGFVVQEVAGSQLLLLAGMFTTVCY